MHAPGKRLDDHLVQVARQRTDLPVVNFNNIQCECVVHSSQVFMDFGPRSKKHAPYLHLLGEVREVRFPETMRSHMYGVDALTFAEGTGLQTDIFYQFSQDELADMVKKGYFDPNFEIPDILRDNDFELPMDCNMTMIEPQRENDPPIVFVGLTNPRNVEFTAETSGYELGSYFEPIKTPSVAQSELSVGNELDDAEFHEFDDSESLFHVELPVTEIPQSEDNVAEDYEDDYEADDVSDAEPVEDEASALLKKYMRISDGVDARRYTSRADIARQLQKASGKPVEEPEVVESVDEPAVEPQSDVLVAVDAGQSGEKKADTKASAAAKLVRIAEANQDANDENEMSKAPRQVPSGLSDIAAQADADEFVDSSDFGDAI